MSTVPRIRVLIADDHPIVRMGLAAMVSAQPELELIGEAVDGEDAVRLFEALRPDVTLVDLRMPRLDGVEAIEAMRRIDPRARIVILTTFDGDEDIYRGLKAGALSYLLKDSARDLLIACITAAVRGEHYLPSAVAEKLAKRIEATGLSRRELQILHHVAAGLSNRDIATATGITEGTVKFHLTSVMTKLGVRTRTEAMSVAIRKGLVRLE